MRQTRPKRNKVAGLPSRKYQSWLDLVYFSEKAALAGLRAQGFSPFKAWKIWCRRWGRSSKEHQQANQRVIQRIIQAGG